jgi:uncharacterized membrane protein YcaP (DUF421 family)
MEATIISISRTFISFIVLLTISIWIGKQVNSHNNYNNYALYITMGSFVANMGFNIKLKFIPMMMAFLSMIFIYFIFSLITTRSRYFRKWFAGTPTVIIENGKLLDRNMKKIRYTLDDLNQQLREHGIFDIAEVEYALLEVSGKLSVMKKAKFQNIIKDDLLLSPSSSNVNLPIELIMDGELVDKNFNSTYTPTWLNTELKKRNLLIKDIQYAVISSNGSFFIDTFNDGLTTPLDPE